MASENLDALAFLDEAGVARTPDRPGGRADDEPAERLLADLDAVRESMEEVHIVAKEAMDHAVVVRGWLALAAQAHVSQLVFGVLGLIGVISGGAGVILGGLIAATSGWNEVDASASGAFAVGSAASFSPLGSAWRDGLVAGGNASSDLA